MNPYHFPRGHHGEESKAARRPPGSKNKGSIKGLTKSFTKMEVGQLRAYIDNLEGILAAKVKQQREILEGQLAGLQIYASNKAAAAVRTVMRVPKTGKAQEARAEISVEENKSMKWTGRGMLPTSMREEMKGTKLTKENFLIK